ncbi:MAG: hypothetical protein AEth_00782 [Candidatus Argoarchaeum ethanivorans]|uniref:Transposase IS66 central domain-containing protein n=1 Tax=Candidatus Argoarchaeum ethanivorans TaxID=2608793 RepID=A0A8B3S4J0_9EURY|nr:MAG: hypothetical protein AEth_00782 [Candidatus Argoarchaeum ethanivorans]
MFDKTHTEQLEKHIEQLEVRIKQLQEENKVNLKQKSALEQLNINLEGIADKKIKEAILGLFNIIEQQAGTNRKLQQENQRLRDEINRLKGEQGKPDIKPNKKKPTYDFSSEKERKKNQSKQKRKSKKDKIKIDRTEKCRVDRDILPPDAEFKGYEKVIVRDLKIETDNIEFQKEVFYSPSQKKTYAAKLPQGYGGGHGPTVKALSIIMKNVCNMSEPNILDFLHNVNIPISAGGLSNILIKNIERFHQEKDELFRAGLESTDYQQIDDTSARVRGKNYKTHILNNPFYTAYFTTEKKDRLTILKILLGGKELKYSINEGTFGLLERLRVSKKYIEKLKELEVDKELWKPEVEKLLLEHIPKLKERPKTRILEALAISYYHSLTDYPVVKIFVCDNAPQFKLLAKELALCWVHDGRHYKKLQPVVPYYAKKLEEFRTRFWAYYHKLLEYKSDPTQEKAELLSDEFDKLFSSKTRYGQLDDRISKTKAKEECLLLVLKYPELPLHNNDSELGARVAVRKRDVSLHTMTEEGTKANDTFLTITQTCKKLGINAYDYIFDRVSKSFKLPSLAQTIRTKVIEERVIKSMDPSQNRLTDIGTYAVFNKC